MNWHFFFLLVAPFEHLKNNIIHFNPEAFYLFTFLKIYCFILCVCVCPCVCWVQLLRKAGGIGSPGTGVTNGCEPLTWVLGPRLGSLESTTRSQSLSHLCSLQGPYFKRLHFDGAAELIQMRPFSVICFVGNLGESVPFLLLCSGSFGSQPPWPCCDCIVRVSSRSCCSSCTEFRTVRPRFL